MSAQKAHDLGLPQDRYVYLHGCADINDIWNVTQRPELHCSPAIEIAARESFAHSGTSVDDLKYLDLYSCFPAVVQIARDALGIPADDSRALTVTGGLPYFGGPGNNYVMHSIATMLEKLRQDPGSYGLVSGNGWYVTKHSYGIYSTTPPKQAFHRTDPAILQREIEELPHVAVETQPTGKGVVETYTVLFDKNNQPETGIVIGRLENQKRFIANTPNDPGFLRHLVENDPIGQSGHLEQVGNRNLMSW